MREKEVEKSIIEYIRAIGGRCQKVHSGLLFQEYNWRKRAIKLADKWTPDILACINWVFLGIEVKKDKKEVEKRWKSNAPREAAQRAQGEGIVKSWGRFFIVSSIKELREDLANIDL